MKFYTTAILTLSAIGIMSTCDASHSESGVVIGVVPDKRAHTTYCLDCNSDGLIDRSVRTNDIVLKNNIHVGDTLRYETYAFDSGDVNLQSVNSRTYYELLRMHQFNRIRTKFERVNKTKE